MATREDKPIALLEMEQRMRQMLDRSLKPYDAGRIIWKTTMSNMESYPEIMHPLWLIWGALTDWVEVKPLEEADAEAAMLRASLEWLGLEAGDAASRTAYFDKWIYEEMGYKRENK